ncbi:MAG: hypothetical protein WBI99_03575 [Limnochordia bacterium]|nr:hypothetical protein [Bacillota bacterium]NLO95819.1 hypothetical protein [Bacillota bacterium]HOQ73077.1 hypothetical protein [Limnochordia bacterium]HPU64520.1 hypothetical protein [Limnochordia bacterium]
MFTAIATNAGNAVRIGQVQPAEPDAPFLLAVVLILLFILAVILLPQLVL